MKRMIALLFIGILLTAVWSAFAANGAETKVHDNAELFTGAERESLEDTARSLRDKYELDILILTVDSFDGSDPMVFAADYYEAHGFGFGDDNAGVILFICMGTRDVSVISTGWAQDKFTYDKCTDIREDITGELSDGNYGDAAARFLKRVRSTLNPWPMYIGISAAIGCGVTLIVVLILVGAHNKNINAIGAQHYAKRPLNLTYRNDRFHSTHTARTRRAENNSSGGGGGGGGFSSSSGGSYTGSSGKF